MKRRIHEALVFLALPLLFVAIGGCGSDDSGMTDGFDSLRPNLQSMDNRLEGYYTKVAGILESASPASLAMPASSSGGLSAAGPPSDPQQVDWDALDRVCRQYIQDMDRLTNDLGESVTRIGTCRMMMQDVLVSPPDAVNTCPCQPYMNDCLDELDRHFSGMQTWMSRQNPAGVWQEMNTHRSRMGSDIQELDSQMRQTYGCQDDRDMMWMN